MLFPPYTAILLSNVFPAAIKSGKFEQSPVKGKLYSEADWNTKATLEDEPYHLSKVFCSLETKLLRHVKH